MKNQKVYDDSEPDDTATPPTDDTTPKEAPIAPPADEIIPDPPAEVPSAAEEAEAKRKAHIEAVHRTGHGFAIGT